MTDITEKDLASLLKPATSTFKLDTRSFADLVKDAEKAETSILKASYYSAAVRVAKTEKETALAEKGREDAIKVMDEEGPMGNLIKLYNAQVGFVNLHTNNEENGKGDGKWYTLDSGKTQHTGEPTMTRGEAIAKNIELG
jgi:hypothetical protein